jgi:pyruvate/2-oxoglutarate dehydrogenase complex dihydrolipoamide dehydrogenase (E3) component
MDDDAVMVLESVLRREGIRLFTGTQLVDAQKDQGLKRLVFKHGGQLVHVTAEEVLFALGRIPNTESLKLEAAGVAVKHGRVTTNSEMRTTAEHIYAAGDCAGLFEAVHLAVMEGETAGHNIAHPSRPKRMDYRLLTKVVFSDPQIASVGLTEKAARGLSLPYLVATYPFADHGKSLILGALDGFVKLIADPATGEILGGGVVGPAGGELVHEIIAAMAKAMTVQELAAIPHYHPTLAEIWTYPAEALAEKVKPGSGSMLPKDNAGL